MANAYSQVHNYGDPVANPNTDLIGEALLYKQKKYDHNKQRLQSLYDEVSSLTVAKDVDREYAEERLNQVKDIADKYVRTGDLSHDGVVQSIMSNIDQFVDDRIVNAAVSTRRIKAEDAVWREMEKKHPDKYHARNEAWAKSAEKSDRERYLSSDEVGDVYKGGANFIEYVDVDKNLSKEMKEIAKLVGAKYVEVEGGNSYFRAINEYEEVDRRKLKEAINSRLGDKERQQLKINAWANYGNISEEGLKKHYESYQSAVISGRNERVEKLKRLIDDGDLDKEQETLARQQISSIEEEVQEYKRQNNFKDELEKHGREGVRDRLYKESWMNSYLNAYSHGPRLLESKAYDIDVKTRKHELEIEKFEHKREIDRERLELQREKIRRADEGEDDGIVRGGREVDKPESTSLESTLATKSAEMQKAYNSLSSTLQNTLSNESEDTRKEFMATLDESDLGKNFIEKNINGNTVVVKMYEMFDSPEGETRSITPEGEAIQNYIIQRERGKEVEEVLDRRFNDMRENVKTALSEMARVEKENKEGEQKSIDYDLETELPQWVTSEGDTYYDLLSAPSNNLTEEQEKQLDYFIASHIAFDPVIAKNKELQEEAKRWAQEFEIDKRITGVTLLDVPSISMGDSFFGSLITGAAKLQTVMGRLLPGSDRYISDFTSKDVEIKGDGAWSDRDVVPIAPNKLLENNITLIENAVEKLEDRIYPSRRKVIVTDESDVFKSLKGILHSELGLAVDTKTIALTQKRSEDGTFEDKYDVTGISEDGPQDPVSLEGDVLRDIGIDTSGETEPPMYTLKSDNPRGFKLGRVDYNEDSYNELRLEVSKNLKDIREKYRPETFKLGEPISGKEYERYLDAWKKVENNTYTFEVVPDRNRNTYSIHLKDGGEVLYRYETGQQEIFRTEYTEYQRNKGEMHKDILERYLLRSLPNKINQGY